MRTLIELPSWLGDCIMTTPAIEGFIDLNPGVEITVIGSAISVEVMMPHPNIVAGFILDKSYLKLSHTVKSLGFFDIFFSFRSSIRSSILKHFVLAPNKYQFNKNRYQQGHQVEKYLNFVSKSLGVHLQSRHLKIYPLHINKNNRPKLGINPGASYGSAKRWYPEEFVKVASQLSNQYDVIIFGGPGEQDIADDIEKGLVQSGVQNYQNLAGKTNISELISQIAGLDLFITGDSGPMHVAAAYQVPTISIFGPTKDEETSQWLNTHNVIVKKDLGCQPCMKRICPLKHHDCMRLIKAEEVLKEVKALI